MSATALPPRRDLYCWQLDALVAWLRCGRRGVVEAVTGSGKTDVAIAAALDARRRDRFVLVVVPSRVLVEQWISRLAEAIPTARIGRLGDGATDRPEDCDILVATRHSAAAYQPLPPAGSTGGLLVADECHGFGGGVLRRALLTPYSERLGLTATLERSDDGVDKLLLPYFGGVCYRYGFGEAIADGVCAQPRVAFVGVPLTEEERSDYIATEDQLVNARQHLRKLAGMTVEPFGAFLAAVGHLAEHDTGPDGRAARDYLDAFSKRRQIVAESRGKYELLGNFAKLLSDAHGALLFTETVRAAHHAINRLDPHVAIELITGSTARRFRKEILADLRSRRLDVVAAPRVLDEGVDVPDANLGIVMSASRTRRQMIQRMGRILRRKEHGVGARFVIMFAKDTIEDPEMRAERDGFIEEIQAISESAAVFDAAHFARVEAFLDFPGPPDVPEPRRLGPYRHAADPLPNDVGARWATPAALRSGDPAAWAQIAGEAGRSRPAAAAVADDLTVALGHEAAYAHLSFLAWDRAGLLHERLWAADAARPEPPAPEYLELEAMELPKVGKPRTPPKRLSTGERPVQLSSVGSAWQLRCTGCGGASTLVQFRWQAMDLTVDCRCA